MEKERKSDSFPANDVYPINLLLAVRGQSDRDIPEALTDDNLAGIKKSGSGHYCVG